MMKHLFWAILASAAVLACAMSCCAPEQDDSMELSIKSLQEIPVEPITVEVAIIRKLSSWERIIYPITATYFGEKAVFYEKISEKLRLEKLKNGDKIWLSIKTKFLPIECKIGEEIYILHNDESLGIKSARAYLTDRIRFVFEYDNCSVELLDYYYY